MRRPVILGTQEHLSHRTRREADNTEALGGMRSHSNTVARVPRAAMMGDPIRPYLDTYMDKYPAAVESTEAVLQGRKWAKGSPPHDGTLMMMTGWS